MISRILMFVKTLFVIILFISCSSPEYIYSVAEVSGKINVDGYDKDGPWDEGKLLTSFTYPWDDVSPPKTTFKAIHDNEYLYFYYYAADEDIRLKQSGDEEMDAVASDRVEIFIRGADDTAPYYSFEMDPQGRVFDSKGEFGKYIDHEYDYPESGLTFKGVVSDEHYTLEGKLDLSTLRELNLISDDGVIMMGLYRGEYLLVDEEEKTYWMSWVTPDSETPNFHIPSAFGKVRLL